MTRLITETAVFKLLTAAEVRPVIHSAGPKFREYYRQWGQLEYQVWTLLQ